MAEMSAAGNIPKETLKNAFRGIFQLASARYTPAPNKSALP
jgi:hypothetical protein